jgi:hypothetical protein
MPVLSHLPQLFNADQCQAYIHTLGRVPPGCG